MFRTFTQELRLLAYYSNEYVIMYTTWSCVSGTSSYYHCSCPSNSHMSTNPLAPLRQAFSVQAVKQEMCAHSHPGRTQNKPQAFPLVRKIS